MTNQANEDEQRTLDEILSQAFTDGASDTMWQDERHVEIFATAKKELLDWHNKQVLEIIGEDEPPEGLTSWYDGIERDSRHREGRNMLREWQRNKLKEIDG